MRVSVIATVYNECHSIQRLLDSLAAQTRPPDEVVICDGGSTDGTAQIVEEYARRQAHVLPNLRLIVAPGANISRGRNLAIEAAAGPLIAATDAGVRLESHLAGKADRSLGIAAVPATRPPIAAAGFFVPDAEGVFQTAMAATVLPLVDEIDPNRFLAFQPFGGLYQGGLGTRRRLP